MIQGSPELIAALREIDPSKPYGTELFDALARVTISVGTEAVALRRNKEGEIEVFMTQRSSKDTAYPSEWHCPGSVMRPGEKIKNNFDRVSEKELGGKIYPLQFVCIVNNTSEARGHFISIVYLCTIEDGSRGQWFPISRLPDKTVIHHRLSVIPAAVGAFVARNAAICS